MKRGDIVTILGRGNYPDKPRPAVVVQSDALNTGDSVLVALLTSTIRDTPLFRLAIEPTPSNGLRASSQVMIDKIVAQPRAQCGPVIGKLSDADMLALNNLLSVMIGLAD